MAAEPHREKFVFAFCKWYRLLPTQISGFAALLLIAVAGCQNTSTTIPSPFVADRVPPVQTRVPGTVQPYHTPAPATPVQPSQQAPPPTLGSTVPAGDVAPLPTGPLATTTNRPPLAGNEPAVRIPEDENSVRFGPPIEPTSVATVTPHPPRTVNNTRPANIESRASAVAPVSLAMESRMSSSPTTVTTPNLSSWPTSSPPVTTANHVVMSQPSEQAGLFRNPTAAVHHAQPEPAPRIRMPAVANRIHEAVVVPVGGIAPAVHPTTPTTSGIQPDGFRPRGSLGQQPSSGSVPVMHVTPG